MARPVDRKSLIAHRKAASGDVRVRYLVPLLLLALTAPALAQSNQINEWLQRRNLFEDLRASELPADTFRYGRGTVSLSISTKQERMPLIVWVAGVDLRLETLTYSTDWLPDFFYEEGYALGRVHSARGDRFNPEAVVRNNATAIARLIQEADPERVDTGRIILMGTGSAGHSAALLATDPRYLEEAGVPFVSIRGVLIIDGEGFDIPGRIAALEERRRRRYERVFGTDPDGQARLSPASQLAPPNSPAFLVHATEGVSDFATQAEAMADSLRNAGSRAEVRLVPPTTLVGAPRTYLGMPQHPQTAELRADLRWLAGLDTR